MFEHEIAVNGQLLIYFSKVAKEIPEDSFFHPSVGHGHPPVWILGHLAIIAEMGQMKLGGSIAHPEWVPMFGPGSSDIIHQNDELNKQSMINVVKENYRQLRDLAAKADLPTISQPHNVALFEGTPIANVGHVITVILTSHFGFHLAQLSSCRRAAGFGPLF
jgi:hypothetical protein